MAVYPGFIGPTFLSQAAAADVERCVNLYPEVENSGTPKNKIILLGTPGKQLLFTLPAGAHRGSFAQDGRGFMVAGDTLYEITSLSTYVVRGTLANDGNRVYFASNGLGGNQLFIVSGGYGYVFNLVTNTLSRVLSTSFPSSVSMCCYFDGYFIVLVSNSITFQISTSEDGTTWNILDLQARSEGSDNFLAIGASQRGVWLFGSKTTEVWYDSGAASFPFAPIPGVFVEEGIAAPASLVTQFDNSLLWLGRNQNGGVIARRAEGYTPRRISTAGVEAQWDTYTTVSDAIGWMYREQGHEFWILTFPTAQATWGWDASTELWHERAYTNPATGLYEADLAISHMFLFNTHIVGDRRNGNVYKQAIGLYDDAGDPIIAMRQTPYIGNENMWMYHHLLELEFAAGVGIDGSGAGTNPLVTMQFSNDGRTWSNAYSTSIGALGAYGTRAQWRRLGRARWRNYRITVSDPVRRAWINAYIRLTPGTS